MPKAPGSYPTPQELALVAATLRASATDQSLESIAVEAVRLWRICRILSDSEASEEEGDEEKYYFGPCDYPYPMARDTFLKAVLPQYKGRTAELAEAGKEFIKAKLKRRWERDPSPDEVAREYGAWVSIRDWGESNEEAALFLQLRAEGISAKRKMARSKATVAHTKRKKVKKLL